MIILRKLTQAGADGELWVPLFQAVPRFIIVRSLGLQTHLVLQL